MANIMIGPDPNQVDDSVQGKQFPLGYRFVDEDGCEYMYLEADATVGQADTVIIHDDGGCQGVTATLAAAGTGNGKQLAVSPGSGRTQAIAAGDFFWGCIYAPGVAGKKAVMDGAAVKYTQLYAGATAGALTDTADLDAKVMGIVCITTAGSPDEEETVVINYPYLATDVDTTT